MSTLKVDSIKSADGNTDLLTLSNGAVSGVNLGRRNLIINGAMQVAQRGTNTTGISSGSNYYTADRWKVSIDDSGAWTATQSTDAPEGFSNSFKLECTTSASISTGNLALVQQAIEGQNLQQLKYGTANAETVTVSFWVKSAKTGTYIFEIYCIDNTRQISKSYTIDSADTWEKKTIVIEGDTIGALDNDNDVSLWFIFWLAAGTSFTSGSLSTEWTANTNANRVVGQVNLADTVGNDFLMTGVQLEVGSVATPFEHRSYGEELALCQRYYQKNDVGSFFCPITRASDSNRRMNVQFPTTMRADPTVVLTSTSLDGGSLTVIDTTPYAVYIFGNTSDAPQPALHVYTAEAEL